MELLSEAESQPPAANRQPPATNQPLLPPIFDGKYSIDPETGCWEWLMGKSIGYGVMWIAGRRQQVRRVAWIAVNGVFQPKLKICSKCPAKSRSCINPAHHYLAAGPRGEHHPSSKLTETEILEIREIDSISSSALATKYKTSDSNIREIRRKNKWVHL